MQVPKHFWGAVVLTACHLINRMPSAILNHRSPFSLLYPNHASFPLTLHVFGCVAFVHVLDCHQDKLAPRAHKCVFLGYSRTKGYSCYSSESRRHFVSVDVTFFEPTSFFSPPGQCLSSDLNPTSEGESSLSSPTLPLPLPSLPNPPLQVYRRS
jgi:hypothetical protein